VADTPNHPTRPGPDRELPEVLAGPVLRRVEKQQIALWLVSRRALAFRFRLYAFGTGPDPLVDRRLASSEVTSLRIGARAWVHLLNIDIGQAIPEDIWLEYDLGVSIPASSLTSGPNAGVRWIRDWAPHLCRDREHRPRFVFKQRLDRVLHGSCRRPHHPADDGLVRVDRELAAAGSPEDYPAVLLMTGEGCRHQAYRVGETAYAFQCHIEVTRPMLERWATEPGSFTANGGADPMPRLQAEMALHLDGSLHIADRVAAGWLDLAARVRQRNGLRKSA